MSSHLKTVKQPEKPEVVASKEELAVLEALSRGLYGTISELLRQRPTGGTAVEIAVHESRYSTLKGHQELAKHCYGRTVIGEETDEDGRKLRAFTYRITQANVGFLDGGCNVLARNSPIASRLVTADPGEESEVNVPKGLRYLTTQEVRTLDGPTSLLSTIQEPNFRSMVVRLLGRKNSIAVQNLRAFVGRLTGLVNAPANDFSPTNMVGFVLSHSLKRYLKETASELGLEQLPSGAVEFKDINEQPDALAQFGASLDDIRRRLHATDEAGRLIVGADVAIALWRLTPGEGWLATLFGNRVALPFTRFVYDRFADLLFAWNKWCGRW